MAKYPKAVAKIADDTDVLLAFYDYPAEHWQHLRTTNPIESTFATVRQRTKVTRGPGSRAADLAMAFKLILAAQERWRAANAPAASARAPIRRRWNLFFSLLQKNVLNRQRWPTREELRRAIVTWIEKTYHRRRRQDSLGHLTPVEFEGVQPLARVA